MNRAAGGELVDTLTKQAYYTETEIAGYIRQLLWGLEYMHSNQYAHLGLTVISVVINFPRVTIRLNLNRFLHSFNSSS